MINLFLQEMLIDFKHWQASLSPAEIKIVSKVVAMLIVVIVKIVASIATENKGNDDED